MKSQKKLVTKVLGLATLLSVVACAHGPNELKPTTEVVKTAQYDDEEEEEISDEDFNRIPASQCHSPKYVDCKDARRNDIADRYMLDAHKTLYRRINNVDCPVTTNVQNFKISQHPNDAAVLYYKKGGNLYMINVDRESRPSGQCPSAKGNTKMLMSNIVDYTVTSNTNTTIVNSALDGNGAFVAWDNVKPVYKEYGVEEFKMNTCFGKSGKSFSSYVLFTRQRGEITKVKVSSSGKYTKDNSVSTRESYASIKEFTKKNNVCK